MEKLETSSISSLQLSNDGCSSSINSNNSNNSNNNDKGKGSCKVKSKRNKTMSIDMTKTATNCSYKETEFYVENKRIGDYNILKILGSGSSAKVFLCEQKYTKNKVAIKVINRNNNIVNRTRIIREILMGTLLNHPHIVKVIDFLHDQRFFFIVFEYVDGDVLYDMIISSNKDNGKGLGMHRIRKYFRQIISAIDYLHKNSIVHRDLKIENIIVDKDDNIRIFDFGLSNFYDSKQLLDTFCGSLYFAAPELLLGKKYNGPQIDIWSLGVILFVMVYGKVPFDDDSIQSLQTKIKNCDFSFPKTERSSEEVEDLIINMILFNPGSRFGIDQIANSKWINDGYDHKLKNYFIRRHPLQKANDEFLLILENLASFQFNNIRGVIDKYITICSNEGNTLEQKYWIRKPIVSLYYLLAETLTQNKGKFCEGSNKIYWETTPIVNYFNVENSNVKCLKEFLSFINDSSGLFMTSNLSSTSIQNMRSSKNIKGLSFQDALNNSHNRSSLPSSSSSGMGGLKSSSLYPLVRRSFVKGILKGIKVYDTDEIHLKKLLIRSFIKCGIVYEAGEKAYVCTYYKDGAEVHFRVSIFYNIILGEYYIALKSLSRNKTIFKYIQDLIHSEILKK